MRRGERYLHNMLNVMADSAPPGGRLERAPASSGDALSWPPPPAGRVARTGRPASAVAPIDATRKISSNSQNIYLRRVDGFGR